MLAVFACLTAYAAKLENDGPGFSAIPDLIKIGVRDGQRLLMVE